MKSFDCRICFIESLPLVEIKKGGIGKRKSSVTGDNTRNIYFGSLVSEGT